ncbi:hypothetical protein PENSPDRAFT_668705 [Peniophora sp. CONT]|nr:hypothetical protein PENSPDRAFT_668705 [Peniophora sp. CONT]
MNAPLALPFNHHRVTVLRSKRMNIKFPDNLSQLSSDALIDKQTELAQATNNMSMSANEWMLLHQWNVVMGSLVLAHSRLERDEAHRYVLEGERNSAVYKLGRLREELGKKEESHKAEVDALRLQIRQLTVPNADDHNAKASMRE